MAIQDVGINTTNSYIPGNGEIATPEAQASEQVLNTSLSLAGPNTSQQAGTIAEPTVQNQATLSSDVAQEPTTSPTTSETQEDNAKYEISKNKSLLAGMALMIGGEVALCGTGAVMSFAHGDSAAGVVASGVGICSIAVTVGLYFVEKNYHSKEHRASEGAT